MKNALIASKIKATLKRHYQLLSDSDSMVADWPQSLTHASLRHQTKNKTFVRDTRRHRLGVYKQQSYEKVFSEALKLWEFQAPETGG